MEPDREQIKVRRTFTVETYEALLMAFRERPGKVCWAARQCKVDKKTAIRAWHDGWPSYSWARPIKEVLKEEAEAAMAEAERISNETKLSKADERSRARKHAVKVLASERSLIRRARVQTIKIFRDVLPPLLRSGVDLAKKVETLVTSSDVVNLGEARKTVEAIVRMQKHAADAAKLVIEMEREQGGDPAQVLKTAGAMSSQSSQAEAQEKILRAARNLRRTNKLNFAVVDGGLSPDGDDDAGDDMIEPLSPIGSVTEIPSDGA